MIALITGGSSSGKSGFAERICAELGGDLVYLAAMKPFGAEGAARVRKHRAARAGKGFTTVECYDGFADVARDERLAGTTVLLECLGNVVANELFSEAVLDIDVQQRAIDAHASIMDSVHTLANTCAHLVVVGNEVGSDGVAYASETRCYQELIGSLACDIGACSNLVAESVAGCLQVLKADAHAQSLLDSIEKG